MPIYEYRCNACDHRLEAMQKMADEPLTNCPKCHEQSLKRLISAAGIQLKGAGWNRDAFESKSDSNANQGTSLSCASGRCGCAC